MKRVPLRMPVRASLLALAVALAAATPARADNLLQIYREAQANDPALASARAIWQATQEKLPQARAGLLPNVSAAVAGNYNNYRLGFSGDTQGEDLNRNYAFGNGTITAAQPIYRVGNVVSYNQAREQVAQADYTLALAQQDLILRVTVAYFDILLAQYNIELVQAQKNAVSEQLAQAKRNFEVGVATITDTNEAQARYDQIIATEISTQNDYDNRVTALRAIINRIPGPLAKLSQNFEPALPEPDNAQSWIDRAMQNNLNVQVAQSTVTLQELEIERQRAGHLPTVDLVASYGGSWGNGSTSFSQSFNTRSGLIGLSVNIPLYQGGYVNSKVREAIALEDNAKAQLEAARRNALYNSQTGFSGVTSSVASIKATAQAVKSAEVAYQSNKLGQEVGVRTNLDVLNTLQNVFTARRDLASAYFNYLIGVLRLKAAVGTLDERDVEDLNRRLAS
ncbi:MAG: TolC family outer membrane protein [Proteobacteria bacterium]|nr:TolC family outer membrane protein [Pseudomonadota bacterium]